jgi:hypothetical protein
VLFRSKKTFVASTPKGIAADIIESVYEGTLTHFCIRTSAAVSSIGLDDYMLLALPDLKTSIKFVIPKFIVNLASRIPLRFRTSFTDWLVAIR